MLKWMKTTFLVLAIACAIGLPSTTDGARILGIFPTSARSHYIVGSALMKELARRGHQVTVINPFPQKKPLENYRDIDVSVEEDIIKELIPNMFDMADQSVWEGITMTYKFGHMITNFTLQHPNVIKLINSNEQFDLVVLESFLNDAHLGFVHRFKAPCVAVSTFGASRWTNEMVGTPSPTSYVPHPFLSFTDRMSFVQRVGNMLMTILDAALGQILDFPVQSAMYEAAFPGPKPPLEHLRKHSVSLVLLNQHLSLSYPRPYVPNMIEVGGMHVNRKPKPLPEDIKSILDGSPQGVIYFSMGSNIKSSQLPVEKREAILRVFAKLKQTVLWKWEDETLPNRPKNVIVKAWWPQDDVLAHPNVRLFITHGGLLSTTEAMYHGVPVIGIPVFGDQYLNMGKAERTGYGIQLPYQEISEERLSKAINEILNNEKYKTVAGTISARYRDQPQNPLDLAVFWVEYVIRHRGAEHLKSAGQELGFLQYHGIDVLATIFGGPLLFAYLLIKLLCGGRSKNAKVKTSADSKKKRN
ncbi:UDP-glycosyltransferase UGT5-like [Anopheles ziemanni]|uniref:UDP-glycosyltransferase UGT5-like n=1 Tax=Anopheles coustani TaxID=139045 RepID=UPI00265B0C67|nr:UDP-glycosyltransferase UGT5-like [Anopheles coustani]XP_058178492.1 UDP-glycosyltransferase UGT5-like [Anopheles ziemanni]